MATRNLTLWAKMQWESEINHNCMKDFWEQ